MTAAAVIAASGVYVHRWEDAAPTRDLRATLVRSGIPVPESDTAGARLVVDTRVPVVRIRPHEDEDECGHLSTHAAYTLTWAVPVLCRLPQPPGRDLDFVGLRRQCWTCADHLYPTIVAGPDALPAGAHLTWWDISGPTTVRAAVIDREERVRRALLGRPFDPTAYSADHIRLAGGVEKVRRRHESAVVLAAQEDRSADRYDWDGLTARIIEWAGEAPRLTAAQRVAVAGARRHLALGEVAAADMSLRDLMATARDDSHTIEYLSELGGISRRTGSGWLAARTTTGVESAV
ncbi:hypothetical protein [Streptomyces sp. NPDC048606]|uniref:hypothetical protein n=1 Tax=Streptomyces sp. NPDC048606 TaxID=3154726 RepID=UPI0034312B6E